MALPQRIQQQLDAAEQLLANANQEPPAPQPPADAPAEAQVEAEPPQPSAPQAAPAAPAPTAPPAENWEHKYRTLQGIHNRHVDELKNRLNASETNNQRLNEQLQGLSQRMDQLTAKTEATPDTSKDAEVFGAELVDMVKRTVESSFGAIARQFDGRLAAMEQRLEGTTNAVVKTTEDLFLDRLAAMVPDYEEINVSDGFLAWLAEKDPVYGVPRQAALTAAADARDADRVGRIFQVYKASITPTAAPAPQPTADPLNRQVAPRSTASAPQVAPAKRAISAADVDQFYRDVRMGVYRGREADMARIEAEINTALAEGRIS